jgi:hypothetical protein
MAEKEKNWNFENTVFIVFVKSSGHFHAEFLLNQLLARDQA